MPDGVIVVFETQDVHLIHADVVPREGELLFVDPMKMLKAEIFDYNDESYFAKSEVEFKAYR